MRFCSGPATTFRASLAVVAIFAAGLSGCSREEDPVAAANTFFQQIGRGQLQEAYESAAFSFQAQQSLKAFEVNAKELGLTQFVSATWEEQVAEERSVRLEGEIARKDGTRSPLIVTLSRESGSWRVYSIRTPRSLETGFSNNLFGAVGKTTSFTENIDRPVPDEKTAREMTLQTMLRFNEAVQQKSFADFYENVSKAWRDQLTVGQLNRAFQPFIDKEVNISGIRDVEPVFDAPPQVNTDGLLVISGHYPTRPYRVIFSLKFIYELPKWELFGIDVQLRADRIPTKSGI